MYVTFKTPNIVYPKKLIKFSGKILHTHTHHKSSKTAASFFHAYMGDVSDFVNFYIREKKIPPQFFKGGLICAFNVKEIPEFCNYFDIILDSKKTYSHNLKTLYRGISILKTTNHLQHKKIGDTFIEQGYLSTSQSEQVGLRFMYMDIGTLRPPNLYDRILLKIQTHHSGINMLEYAKSDSLRKEKEILFPSKTSFTITSKYSLPMYNEVANNYLVLEIKEI
jgi:hypothetical protein